jgi:hypothetical protein
MRGRAAFFEIVVLMRKGGVLGFVQGGGKMVSGENSSFVE